MPRPPPEPQGEDLPPEGPPPAPPEPHQPDGTHPQAGPWQARTMLLQQLGP